MRKILPLLLGFLFIFLFFQASSVLAQTPAVTLTEGSWVNDSQVTFVGKVGARSGAFLDWTLQNYNWSFVPVGQQNPLATFWATTRNIVYAFFIIMVLISAIIMIVTRGRSITITRFIPRFIMMVLLVTFSFSLVQFFYQIGDAIQGFFLRDPSGVTQFISQKNLLFIGFDYESFIGFRKFGIAFDESAFISLLMVKMTALTYYAMVGVLLLRKILLWFFLIVSPIFPLLLLYSPLRNTGKIWIGEFFRWLLYAPLFSVLLSGLVHIWRAGIPLQFDFSNVGDPAGIVYPTSINILIGGPGQLLSLTNSLNTPNTFAQYVVALIMLWVVILLPFVLLKIFLDYFKNFSLTDSTLYKQIRGTGGSPSLVPRINPEPNSQPPNQPFNNQPAGLARKMPTFKKVKLVIPEVRSRESDILSRIPLQRVNSQNAEIMHLTNLSVPTMRDIARFETSALSKDSQKNEEMAKIQQTLQKISNPQVITDNIEREKYQRVRDRLVLESQRGNSMATSVLRATSTITNTTTIKQEHIEKLEHTITQIMNPESASTQHDRDKLAFIKNQLLEAQKNGDPLAQEIVKAVDKDETKVDEKLEEKLKNSKKDGDPLATTILDEAGIDEDDNKSTIPAVNDVQSVSLDDYEAVKKMWLENYQQMDPPVGLESGEKSRAQWVSADIEKITEAINLLSSGSGPNEQKGMDSVGAILPVLLMGGFSKTEIIAYLKAKLEAAKQVAAEIAGKDDEESTLLDAKEEKVEKPKAMTEEAELGEDTDPNIDNNKN